MATTKDIKQRTWLYYDLDNPCLTDIKPTGKYQRLKVDVEYIWLGDKFYRATPRLKKLVHPGEMMVTWKPNK